jgi:predicted NBD/HSP70 family sugar kinase
VTRALAIDIGGTKFSMAVFDGDGMVARESRATDRGGGREWMLAQIAEIGRSWRTSNEFDVCGIGFGGPVDFAAQRVALSTHIGGWTTSTCLDSCAPRSASQRSWTTMRTSGRSERLITEQERASTRCST